MSVKVINTKMITLLTNTGDELTFISYCQSKVGKHLAASSNQYYIKAEEGTSIQVGDHSQMHARLARQSTTTVGN